MFFPMESFASRTLASPTNVGRSRRTVLPGLTLMMPGDEIARAAANAASALSNAPIGAAALANKSTAFAERAAVIVVEPEPDDVRPEPSGPPDVAVLSPVATPVPTTPVPTAAPVAASAAAESAAAESAAAASDSAASSAAYSGDCAHTAAAWSDWVGYLRVTDRSAVMSSPSSSCSCVWSLWKGGKPETRVLRVRLERATRKTQPLRATGVAPPVARVMELDVEQRGLRNAPAGRSVGAEHDEALILGRSSPEEDLNVFLALAPLASGDAGERGAGSGQAARQAQPPRRERVAGSPWTVRA